VSPVDSLECKWHGHGTLPLVDDLMINAATAPTMVLQDITHAYTSKPDYLPCKACSLCSCL